MTRKWRSTTGKYQKRPTRTSAVAVDLFAEDTLELRTNGQGRPCRPFGEHPKGAKVVVRFKGGFRKITVSRDRGLQFQEEIKKLETELAA